MNSSRFPYKLLSEKKEQNNKPENNYKLGHKTRNQGQ